jgi:hypothetical protein
VAATGGPARARCLPLFLHPHPRTKEMHNPLASRSVDQCYMDSDPSTPAATAVGGCLTDCAISPALPMPYNGGRVVFASRASFPDEGRGAYAK